MLIGAHVSSSGGLVKAHVRGVERGCDAIQIFHQSPRAWRPAKHRDEDIERFRALLEEGPVTAVVIHAVYLINCASREPEVRSKSIAALKHALALGGAIGAEGVVLHPGSQKGEPYDESLARVGEALREALAETEGCPLLLENTAGMNGTIGRSFDELADVIERAGGDERIGLCLDCCHMLASGFEIRTPDALAKAIDDCDAQVGLERLRCLHVNDSRVPLGANRDLHENLPDGELGPKGLATFLSEPRFEGLPALIETAGPDGHGADGGQVEIARKLRRRGLRARSR
jgi:deoxyribonuclease-4